MGGLTVLGTVCGGTVFGTVSGGINSFWYSVWGDEQFLVQCLGQQFLVQCVGGGFVTVAWMIRSIISLGKEAPAKPNHQAVWPCDQPKKTIKQSDHVTCPNQTINSLAM